MPFFGYLLRTWEVIRFHFYFKEIKYLASLIQVVFQHVGLAVNGLADVLAKQGASRVFSLVRLNYVFLFV